MSALPGQPVGRGARARERVMAAALDQLADEGSAGFTMEAIARRAGASKATLYRRWPSASALLVDAMASTFRPFQTPPGDDVREELVALLTMASEMLASGRFPRLMAAIVDLAERDPALASLHVGVTAQQRRPVLQLVRRAQAQGEIAPDADPEVVVDMLTAPFFYRRLVAHRPIPTTLARSLVDQVLLRR
jgi:AcrR family transcriptional regulator